MSDDTCHSDRAIAPWGPEGEVKLVIFHILVTRNISLYCIQCLVFDTLSGLTDHVHLASPKVIGDGFSNCWLLSDAEYLGCHTGSPGDVA